MPDSNQQTMTDLDQYIAKTSYDRAVWEHDYFVSVEDTQERAAAYASVLRRSIEDASRRLEFDPTLPVPLAVEAAINQLGHEADRLSFDLFRDTTDWIRTEMQ